MPQTQTNGTLPRNLSRHQFGSLKFIADNVVTVGYLRHFHAGTLSSLAQNAWIVVIGNPDNPDSRVELTKLGKEEVEYYDHASFNERNTEADLTDRCIRLLRHAKKFRLVTKAAS